jgi:predicted HAD superfamily Cof-like phosphohydrolase
MQQAEEFRSKFKLPNNRLSRHTQQTLIAEEFSEFIAEARQIYDKKFYRNDEDCLKELADLVYVCFQYAANMEWDLDEALSRVHRSNLSKLGEDGQPIYREDGKVLKGPHYKPPTLNDLVQ